MRSGLALREGDALSGNPVSVSADTLRIQPYWAGEEVEIPVSELSHYLQPGPASEPLESFSILHLKSGDTLLARDVSRHEEGDLQITTLWDQALTVHMERLRAIRFYDRQRLWAQPVVPADHSFPSLAGRTQLHTGGPLYQTLPLAYPDSFVVEIDLQVPGDDFQVQIQLFGDETRNNLGRVVLELSERRISTAWFRRVENQGFRVESWQAGNPTTNSRFCLRLFADMNENRYSLYLDDHFIKAWNVEHMGTLLRGSETPILIRSTAGIEPVWLNALRVLRWRGEPAPPAFLSPAPGSETVLTLADGQQVRGRLHDMDAEVIRFQSDGSSDAVSYERAEVVGVVFPDAAEKRDRSPSPEAPRFFTNHAYERIQVEQADIHQGTLRAKTEWTDDELAVPLDRVQLLDFQPGNRRGRPEESSRNHPHQLRLLNGDQLTGTYLGQEAEWVIFQPGWQTTPLRIHGKFVDRLSFGFRPPPSEGGWTLLLSNGDTFSGRLMEKSASELWLETEWSTRLRIRMPQVVNLWKRPPGEFLLERGPTSMDDWVYSNRRESVLTGDENQFLASTDGWWLTRGGMVRKRLPEVQGSFRFSVHILVSASGRTSGGAGIALTTLPNEEGGYRMLQLSQRGDQWILNVTDPRHPGAQPIALSSVVPDENGSIRFVFEYAHSDKHIRIFANGVLTHEWREPEGSFTGEGYQPMIAFSVNGADSRLLIREWKLHDLPSEISFPSDSVMLEARPRVWLSNGDYLEGTWNGLSQQGHWLITPSGSDEAFALTPERIQGYNASAEGEERIKRKTSHVRLRLNGGVEEFIAELVSADAEGFRVRREGTNGEWTVPLEQVERVEYNPYWTGPREVEYPEGTEWMENFRR